MKVYIICIFTYVSWGGAYVSRHTRASFQGNTLCCEEEEEEVGPCWEEEEGPDREGTTAAVVAGVLEL